MLWNFLAAILIVYALLCVAMLLFQRSMVYHPTAVPLTPLPRLTLQTEAGLVFASTRILDGSPGAIVYFGGNAEDVAATLPEFAEKLPQHSLYFLHYRGYGGSAGAPAESALLADALALFDRVHAAHPHVAIIGRSLGSSLATFVASQRQGGAMALVLLTPFDSIVEVAAHHFPYLPVRWLLKDKYESWRWAPRVTAKTLIVEAGRDEVIPRESMERLTQHFAPKQATLVAIPGADHNSLDSCPEEVIRFLETAAPAPARQAEQR